MKEPFPAAEPPPVARTPRARGALTVSRVLPDGRLELAGEPASLSIALLRHARAVADGGDPRLSLAELLDAVDAALAQGTPPPRLELLRAAAVLETAAATVGEPLVTASLERARALQLLVERPPEKRTRRPGASLDLPVHPGVITSFFGLRRDPFDGRERYHLGLDLEAEEGQVVLAARAGRVISAGWAGGHGNRVELAHEGELVTGYSHLAEVLVVPGQDVARGQVLGRAGSTGRATGPHLHFEVWREGEPEDPLDLLGDAAVEVRATVPR